MDYIVKLDDFEGPLDLLVYLIEKSKVDIAHISINSIADQYFEYIKNMDSINMDVASDFLVMASTLLKLKSESLLPKRQIQDKQLSIDEADPQEVLRQRLVEYKKYKTRAQKLASNYKRQRSFYRNRPALVNNFQIVRFKLKEIPLKKLTDAYAKLVREKQNSAIQRRIAHNHIKAMKPINIEEKIEFLKRIICIRKTITFYYLVDISREKSEIIAYFLAVLEMLRLKQICAVQKKNFGDIVLKGVVEGDRR